jgi:hypothetical protein
VRPGGRIAIRDMASQGLNGMRMITFFVHSIHELGIEPQFWNVAAR